MSPPISEMPRFRNPSAKAFATRSRTELSQLRFTQMPRSAIFGMPPIEEMSETFETMHFSTASSGEDQSRRKCEFSADMSFVTSQPSKAAQSSPAPNQKRSRGETPSIGTSRERTFLIKLNSPRGGKCREEFSILEEI